LSKCLALAVSVGLETAKGAVNMANMGALNQTIEGTDSAPAAAASVELTEGQKECLRLVDDHLTSKEIARFLGISHFTVDQRLDAARRKLNAATRKDAAKIFAAIEHRAISEPFVYETQDLERQQYAASQNGLPKRVGRIVAGMAARVSVPPIGGERHDLSPRDILVQSLNIAFFSTVAFAFVVAVLTGTFRLFQ
jgi:DNA-binding CsgD family transcriptional regulator